MSSLHSLQYNTSSHFYAKYLRTILCIVGGYLVLFLIDQSPAHGYHTTCPFKLITGIPCPGCGMGRATLELAKGNVLSSLHYNMLCIPFTLTMLTILIWMVLDLFRRRETIYPLLMSKASTPATVIMTLVIATNWMLNIMHHV